MAVKRKQKQSSINPVTACPYLEWHGARISTVRRIASGKLIGGNNGDGYHQAVKPYFRKRAPGSPGKPLYAFQGGARIQRHALRTALGYEIRHN